jgi:hypothetical protein
MPWWFFVVALYEFEEWEHAFNRSYSTSLERNRAESAFYANDQFIRNFTGAVTLGHNIYSDMEWSVFRRMHLSTRPAVTVTNRTSASAASLYAMHGGIDWQARGAISAVRQQGQCGSCWAFSATEAIEANLFVNSGQTLVLAPQTLLDCDAIDHGCDGGTMESAFEYVVRRGICTEEENPYRMRPKACTCTPRVKIRDFVRVSPSEGDLTRALLVTPVSVSIEADHRVFQFYKSGVLDASTCGTDLDHGVLLVGYGFGERGYWRIKNSWSTGWGEDGFARLARDTNTCGIWSDASYPVGAQTL